MGVSSLESGEPGPEIRGFYRENKSFYRIKKYTIDFKMIGKTDFLASARPVFRAFLGKTLQPGIRFYRTTVLLVLSKQPGN